MTRLRLNGNQGLDEGANQCRQDEATTQHLHSWESEGIAHHGTEISKQNLSLRLLLFTFLLSCAVAGYTWCAVKNISRLAYCSSLLLVPRSEKAVASRATELANSSTSLLCRSILSLPPRNLTGRYSNARKHRSCILIALRDGLYLVLHIMLLETGQTEKMRPPSTKRLSVDPTTPGYCAERCQLFPHPGNTLRSPGAVCDRCAIGSFTRSGLG